MRTSNYKILAEKNVIDDHLLDIIGNEFKFDHEKGLAEWLKNSVDAYIRSNVPDNRQFVTIRFIDSLTGDASIECIDYNGMTSTDIDKALKRWGDPEAAKRGLRKRVYGGHGNGGKFYMRQMFEKSYFITYKDGLLNVFGFNEDKKYGFASGYKNKKASLLEALMMANLKENKIPLEYLTKLKNNKCGLTLVRGVSPVGMKNKIKAIYICEKIKKHPQAMRLLDRININVIHNSDEIYNLLKPDTIKPLKDFDTPTIISIPQEITYHDNDEIITVKMANNKYAPGRLILKTSETAFTSNSKYSDLNRIDIIGELGVVASYQLRELGLYYPQTDFIYGECECPILEDSDDDCIMNDRTKLADNQKTKALLVWIKSQVKELCENISSKEEGEREDINKKLSSTYNDFLNAWKNKFMSRVMSEILIGPGTGPGVGYGNGGTGKERGDNKSNKHRSANGDNVEGGGDKSAKGSRFPRVLLSGYDDDPVNPGSMLNLQPGHGLIYQRAQDVTEGIYWINTSGPLASAILKKFDANSPRWRDYLFQRYVDIFIKEALFNLEKRDPERFNAFTIDGEILGKMILKIHDVAAKDLNSFLFSDKYETS